MYNLLNIYQEIYKFNSSTEEQLYKLANKYFQYKGWTPPPGGKIPENVKIKQVISGKEKRFLEKNISTKELRGIGRGLKPRWSKQDEINKTRSTKKLEKLLKKYK